jgi:hypothetical protein
MTSVSWSQLRRSTDGRPIGKKSPFFSKDKYSVDFSVKCEFRARKYYNYERLF